MAGPTTEMGYDQAAEFDDPAEALVIEFATELGSLFRDAPPPQWHNDWVYERPNSKRKVRIPVPIKGLQVRPWKGITQYDTASRKWVTVLAKLAFVGVQALADVIEDSGDIDAFGESPADIKDAIDNYDAEQCGSLLNNGHTILDYTGTNFFAAANKPINPFRKSLGTFGNLITGGALDEATIKAALILLQQMRRFDGRNLGFIGTHLLAPTALYEDARRLCEVYDLIANTAGTAGGIRSGTFGRLKAVHCQDLNPKRYIVAHMHKRIKPLVKIVRPNDLEPVIDLKDSPRYKTKRKLATGMWVNRGYQLFCPQSAVAVDLP